MLVKSLNKIITYLLRLLLKETLKLEAILLLGNKFYEIEIDKINL